MIMKPYKNYKSEANNNGSFKMLPAGAYVAGVKNVKIDGTEPDQQLVLRLDIIEGEYTAYYTRRYEHDSNSGGTYAVKYKGDFRIQIPNEKNKRREHPEWDERSFNHMAWCFEQSNPGYKWDWDEKSLKGLVVGINVREGTYNGNLYTQIGRLEVADDVRNGLVKPMKPKAPSGSAPEPAIDEPSGFVQVNTEELPF